MRAHATPRVSMAVPVYNGERYLGEALDSLLAQTYHDFELIICDNASTDGTGEIARSYASIDERVRYVRNERNLGLAGNVKRAFQLSSGEYFRWHAADDVCAPQFLARCVAVLDRHPAVVLAYPRTKLIDADGRVTAAYDDGLHLQAARPSVRFQQLLERVGYVNAQFGLLRAEVLRRTGLLGSYPAADVVFVAQLSLHGRFWEVPSFLFYRRFHPGAAGRMDRAQLRVVWDPTSRRRVHLPEWRYLLELGRAIAWAPIGLAEQLRAGRFLARRAIWNRDKLAREVWAAMRQLATAAGSETSHTATFLASRRSITTAPPVCSETATSSPRRRKSASRARRATRRFHGTRCGTAFRRPESHRPSSRTSAFTTSRSSSSSGSSRPISGSLPKASPPSAWRGPCG